MRYEPKPFQKEAIKFALQNGRCALWFDPGLGKTSITYAVLKVLKAKKMLKRALVVAPLNVVHNVWPRERQKWEDFRGFTLKVLHGPKKDQRLREPADVYLINYEGLEWLINQLNDLKDPDYFDVCIFDEASKTKNPGSKRFKMLKNWAPRFKRVIELTGTPTPNGLQDVWAQIYLLDQGRALGRFVTHFREAFFHQVGFGGFKLVIKKGSAEHIQQAVAPMVLRMAAKDWLDMPPLVKNDVLIDLDPKLMKQYSGLEEQLIVTVSEKRISVPNAAAALNKCLQFCNGAVYHEDGETWSEVHQAKLDALEDLVDELGGKPILVGYVYRHDLARLQKRFPGVPYIGSGVKPAEVSRLLTAWNKGELPMLFGQPQSMAHGLNMQEGPATNIALFGMFYNLEDYIQFIGRVWRQGQTQRVVVHHLLIRDTVDEVVRRVLDQKDHTQSALLEAVKKFRD